MATTYGTIPLASWPLAIGATTVPGTAGNTPPSFTTPVASGTLTVNGNSVNVRPFMQNPGDLTQEMLDAGISVGLDRNGLMILPGAVTISGQTTILGCLGLTSM